MAKKPPSGESTTTERGFNYQLLAVINEVAQWGAPSCSQPQSATDNGVRDGRSNWLGSTPHPTQGSTPWAPRIAHCNAGCKSQLTCCTESAANVRLQNARPTHCRCGHNSFIHKIRYFSWFYLEYLEWFGVVSKQSSLHYSRVGDSTILVNSHEPYDDVTFHVYYYFLLRCRGWAFCTHQELVLEIRRAQIWIFQF